jgi:hypothetical protein
MDTPTSYFDETSIASWTSSKHSSTVTFTSEPQPKTIRLVSFDRYDKKYPPCDIVIDSTTSDEKFLEKCENDIYNYAKCRDLTVIGFCDDDRYASIDLVEQLRDSQKLSGFALTICHLDF